ncbi:MAG: mercury(II) reductase [Alphaproteobacteria bacterium]|nr:mercury(II) reductase [Alphaproteobacteria bacterium]
MSNTPTTIPTGPFDLCVIGAGSAGFSAAITAANQGAKVALIGYGTIGGTCVNFGCVPSKALIRAVEVLHMASSAARFNGITANARITDWKALVAQKQALVDELRQAKYADLLPAYKTLTYIEGKAAFLPDGSLAVNGTPLAAEKIILATGARPAIPPIPGMADIAFLTSTTALELEELPGSLLVIGAGYIGVEIAQIFARAGVAVTLFSRRGLLPEAEPEISKALTGYFNKEGISTEIVTAYDRIETGSAGIVLHVDRDENTETFDAEEVLIATGRTPNIDGLNLDAAGIAINSKGGVLVDAHMQTTRPGVYAAGDVTGTDQFVYMAAYGARIAAENAMGNAEQRYDNSAMPAVVFSDPQIASVGHTQASATAAGFTVKTSVLTLDNVPRALAARDTRGVIKLIADAKSKKLLGAHILAPEGADTIQTAVMAIKAGMTYSELGATIFPYLTNVEGLKLAAQTFDMNVKNLSCCAG